MSHGGRGRKDNIQNFIFGTHTLSLFQSDVVKTLLIQPLLNKTLSSR